MWYVLPNTYYESKIKFILIFQELKNMLYGMFLLSFNNTDR